MGFYLLHSFVWAAGGSGSLHYPGGAGGFASGTIELAGGEVFEVVVGAGGLHACRDIDARTADKGLVQFLGEGGKLSGLFRDGNPIIIAGGGGAGGYLPLDMPCDAHASGGAGGGKSAENGGGLGCVNMPAEGGRQDSGGLGAGGSPDLAGSYLQGGRSGGGQGYYGGGGAAPYTGGAAGGSGYLSPLLVDERLTAGSGAAPPETRHRHYQEPAGQGGHHGCEDLDSEGKSGLIVLEWQA